MNSFIRVWVHMIFSTKNRVPMINPEHEGKIYDHMQEQLNKLGCLPIRINGMPDHVHLLFLLSHTKTIADIAKQVKGNTSHWINTNNLCSQKFAWQDGVRVFGVSESMVARTKNYIDNQKRHHSKLTHAQECEQLMQEFRSGINPNLDAG